MDYIVACILKFMTQSVIKLKVHELNHHKIKFENYFYKTLETKSIFWSKFYE